MSWKDILLIAVFIVVLGVRLLKGQSHLVMEKENFTKVNVLKE